MRFCESCQLGPITQNWKEDVGGYSSHNQRREHERCYVGKKYVREQHAKAEVYL